jgi:uncharacterized protein (DUF427 family)
LLGLHVHGHVPAGMRPLDAELYTQAGLGNAQALPTATFIRARMTGMADRTGSIAPGKTADINLVDGDVSNNVANLRHVDAMFLGGHQLGGKVLREASGLSRMRNKTTRSLLNSEINMKAIWKGAVIAESPDTVIVEGNHYFPLESVNTALLEPSSHTSVCPWKGLANYYSLNVNGEPNADAVWYYAEPKEAAAQIKGRVAFWKGVSVIA